MLKHYGYKPIGQPSRPGLSPFHILLSFPHSWYHMHQPPRNTIRLVSYEVVQCASRAHPLLVGTGLLGDIEEKEGRTRLGFPAKPRERNKGTWDERDNVTYKGIHHVTRLGI
jgi:hypothetical protein